MKLSPHELHESPWQTRDAQQVAKIEDLIRSIRLNGQDEAVEVYKDGDQWVIFEGHRRVLACAHLGRDVRCRVVKKPEDQFMIETIFRRNTCRRNHRPGSVLINHVRSKLQEHSRAGLRKSFRRVALELGVNYEKLRRLYSLWMVLNRKDAREAQSAVREQWSEQEIRVALGLPHDQQHRGARAWYGPVKPLEVVIHRNDQGLWMTCKMQDDADPELIKEYYHSRKWPNPVVRIAGHVSPEKITQRLEALTRLRAEQASDPPEVPREI